MCKSRLAYLIPCFVLACAAPAWSQDADAQRPELFPERYVMVTAGATLSDTTAVFAGEYGEAVGRRVIAFANYSYYDNLMGGDMRSNLDVAGTALTSITGRPFSFTGRDQAFAFTMGATFTPLTGGVRPYIGAGFGAVHFHRTIEEASLGNVTTQFTSQTGLNDGVVDPGTDTATHALAEALVGVHAVAGRTIVDVGYRYKRAFNANSFSFSQFVVGVGVGF